MTKVCKAIIDFVGCEYELFERKYEASAVLNRYTGLRQEGKTAGFTPLIIIPSDVLAETLEYFYEDYDVEESPEGIVKGREQLLKKIDKVDTEEFLGERLAEYTDMHEGDDITGTFIDTEVPDTLSVMQFDGKPYQELIIAKVPTGNPWELAVWLPMGGFNDCPGPAEQAAVFRRWYKKYGAVPAVVGYDTWDLTVEKPVTSDADCETLAKEHFAFSYDNVMQAGEPFDSIRGLASTLRGAAVWGFWWD